MSNNIDDNFEYISGSRIWPSDDPNDSPIDIFGCIHCGFEIEFKANGSFFTGEKEKIALRVNEQKINHLLECRQLVRKNIVNVIGFEKCICHHPELVNLYGCSIGEQTKIGAFVEIGAGVIIGKNCKIETNAFIPPGVIIGDRVFIGPGAILCNTTHPMEGENYKATYILDGAVIGAGAVILPGVTIGQNAVIGAGSVVVKSVPDGVTVVGNPARPI